MELDYSLHYRQFHDESDEHAGKMAEWLCAYLGPELSVDPTTTVLDFGCGFGFALRALRKLGFVNIKGMETSAQQAKVAENAGFSVSVVDDSIGYLKGLKSSFGVILLLDVLEHIPGPLQIELIRCVREALTPNGKVILTVPNANSPLAARWRYIDYTHYCSFTEHSLNFVLASAGFSEIRIDNSKGIGRFPIRLWRRDQRDAFRKWFVRFLWSQVYAAELPSNESVHKISFESNLKAIAVNRVNKSNAEC
jgi:SAM-dependent methyltransferase